MSKTKNNIYFILMAVYCCALIVSNIIAGRTFEVFGFMLPSAVIIFPVVYIVNDVMTECFGFAKAKFTIIMAFILNFISVLIFQCAINLPTSQDFTAYNLVLGSTVKSLAASFCGYLVGSFTNAYIMKVMKKIFKKQLFARCAVSTLFGELLDASIFISAMFVGVLSAAFVMQMIILQATVKIVYEIIVYPVTRKVIGWISNLPED